MKIWLAPHEDDETLFGAFTLIREKPLVIVITDSWIQFVRGDGITADQRWEETVNAMKILDCPVLRLGIRDDIVDEWAITDKLSRFKGIQEVYAPAVQGGNVHHDLVGTVAPKIFGDKVKYYTTYTLTDLWTTGKEEVVGTPEEFQLKNRALDCYVSQKSLPSTMGHFSAVHGRNEWYT